MRRSASTPKPAPVTIDDVDAFSQEINRIEDGVATRIGMIPWRTYGFGNSIYTWGWAFGGSFYDEANEEVTPEDEHIVASLQWMVDSAKAVGGPDAVSVTPPGLQVHFFGGGNVGMSPMVSVNFRDVKRYNPDLQIGQGLLPYQPPGEQDPGSGAWISGWRLFMPTGAENPEAAWDFMYWITNTPRRHRDRVEDPRLPARLERRPRSSRRSRTTPKSWPTTTCWRRPNTPRIRSPSAPSTRPNSRR